MPPARVTLHAVPCGDPELGLWCDRCQLPALIRFRLAVSTATSPIALTTLITCTSGCYRVPKKV